VQHPPELYVGLMSGTSLDGVDAVFADLSRAQPKLLAKHYLPFDDALRNELLALHQPGHNELHRTQLPAINWRGSMPQQSTRCSTQQTHPAQKSRPSAATAKPSATARNTATRCKSATPHYSPS